LSSKNFKNITDLLGSFLKKFIGTENYPSIGVIGIPGPIFDNTIKIIANLEWPEANGKQVANDLKMKNIIFLNDFVTNGYGILSDVRLNKDYVKLNDKKVDPNGPIAMIGAGTGLGHGYLVKHEHGRYHHVFPSEGGHQDFAPQNETEWRYFKFLQTHYKLEHVSIERACSGPAIPVILLFMIQSENQVSLIFQTNEEILQASPEQIIKFGLEKKCSVCEKVIEFFVSIYAAAAGNMSLLILPTGGLYLLGGLSVALEKYIMGNDTFIVKFKLLRIISRTKAD
jgi:glucokinase